VSFYGITVLTAPTDAESTATLTATATYARMMLRTG